MGLTLAGRLAAVLPTVLDVIVETPDYTQLTLKVRRPYPSSCKNFTAGNHKRIVQIVYAPVMQYVRVFCCGDMTIRLS